MTRTLDVQFKVLRKGADYGWIYPAAKSLPTLRMDSSAALKTSLSGSFAPQTLDNRGRPLSVDFLTDEIEPVLLIDGVAHSAGVFLPATVTPSEENGIQTLEIEAYDRCWRIQTTVSETRVSFPAGTKYLDAVEQLLVAGGVSTISKTDTQAAFPQTREDWPIGTDNLTIINELLAEISYKPLWFDSSGFAVLEPFALPTASNIRHKLDGSNVRSLMLPRCSRKTDIYSAANYFLCICSNADKNAPLVASAENLNPQSPISVPRRGRRIVRTERVNNVASLAELQTYADRLRDESILGSETIKVSTALLPGFGVGDVVWLHYGDLSAVCSSSAWTMQLGLGGEMEHTLERTVAYIG